MHSFIKNLLSFSDRRKLPLSIVIISAWTSFNVLRMMPPHSVMITNPSGNALNNSYNSWAFAHYNYSDILSLWLSRGLYLHRIPYISNRIEYPVLTGLFMWIAAWFPSYSGYFIASAVAIALSILISFNYLYKLINHWAWLYLLCPMLYSYELLNWDYFAICFLIIGIYYANQENFFKSGLFFSLGTFAKLFPVFFAFYYFLSFSFTRQKRQRNDLLKGFFLSAIIANIFFIFPNISNWLYFYTFNLRRPGPSSFLSMFYPVAKLPEILTELSSIIVPIFGFILSVWLLKKSPAQVLEVSGLFLTIFLIGNKVFSPQYIVWVYVVLLILRAPIWLLISIAVGGLIDFICVCLTVTYWDSGIPQIISYEERYIVLVYVAAMLFLKIKQSANIELKIREAI